MIFLSRRSPAASFARLLVLMLFTLFLGVGCGSSSDDYVVAANNNNSNGGGVTPVEQTGSVTFNFVRAQGYAFEVPPTTTRLRFRFYDGPNGTGNLVKEVIEDFNNSLTIEGVTVRIQSVIITPVDSIGAPLVQIAIGLRLVPNGNVIVDTTGSVNLPVTAASISVSPAVADVEVGGTRQYSSSVVYSNGDRLPGTGRVTWSASGGSATISPIGGLATGVAPGNTTITATADGVSGTAILTTNRGAIASVALSPSSSEAPGVITGSSIAFSVTARDVAGNPVNASGATYSVVPGNDGGAATFSPTGVVTATRQGTVTVRVTLQGFTDSTTLTIRDTAGSLVSVATTSTPDPASVQIGQTVTLTSVGQFAQGSRTLSSADSLVYTSADPSVATVNPSTGVVSGVRQGSTNVTASVGAVVGNPIPVTVAFATGGSKAPTLNVTGGGTIVQAVRTAAFSTVSFDDDQQFLNGGSITLTATGGAVINVPNTNPLAGAVQGNGTGSVRVPFAANAARPATVGSYLAQSVTLDTTAAFGNVTVSVVVNDGTLDSPTGTVAYNVRGANAVDLTVDPTQADIVGVRYNTIQKAVAYVASSGGATSTINVASGNYTTETIIDIIADPDLAYLSMRGANAGVSAGVTPGTRGAESDVRRINVSSNNVTIDGFRFNTGNLDIPIAGGQGTVALMLSSNADNAVIKNSLFVGTSFDQNSGITNRSTEEPPLNVTATDNGFSGWVNPVYLSGEYNLGPALTGVKITGSAFNGNYNGIVLYATGDAILTGNGFNGLSSSFNNLYVRMSGTSTYVDARGCEFNLSGDIESNSSSRIGICTLDVSNSWWGRVEGPYSTQTTVGEYTTIKTTPFSTTDLFPGFSFGP